MTLSAPEKEPEPDSRIRKRPRHARFHRATYADRLMTQTRPVDTAKAEPATPKPTPSAAPPSSPPACSPPSPAHSTQPPSTTSGSDTAAATPTTTLTVEHVGEPGGWDRGMPRIPWVVGRGDLVAPACGFLESMSVRSWRCAGRERRTMSRVPAGRPVRMFRSVPSPIRRPVLRGPGTPLAPAAHRGSALRSSMPARQR
jgi:hypothetical protein